LHDSLLKNGLETNEQVQVHRLHTGPVAFSAIKRRTASAFSASDNGSKAIISNALAKPPSLDSTAAAGAGRVSATAFDRLRRAFSGLLVQPVVQRESSVAVSRDRLRLRTTSPQIVVLEVAGSSPASHPFQKKQASPFEGWPVVVDGLRFSLGLPTATCESLI